MRVVLVFVLQLLLGHSDRDQQSGNNAVKWYSSAVNNSMQGKFASFKATQKGLMWDIFIWSFSISHSWEPLSTAPRIAHPQCLQECQQSPMCQMNQCHSSPQVVCTVFYCVDLSLHFLQTDWTQMGSRSRASPATLPGSARGDFSCCVQVSVQVPPALTPGSQGMSSPNSFQDWASPLPSPCPSIQD